MGKDAIHTPAQLMQADELLVYKDLIKAITDPNKTYTKEEIKEKINLFLGKKVQ